MNLVKVISSEFDSYKKRIVKLLRFGKDDVQTAIEAAPYGVDSSPIKGMVAVYMPTSEKGKSVIVGYLNKNQLAEPGEHRIYSTGEGGELKFSIWLKNDGTCEIGGNNDNAVRYSELSNELTSFTTKLQAELVKIASGITTAGGAYTPAQLTIDISKSKVDKIKFPSQG